MDPKELDFGELSSDENFKERILDMRNELLNTENMLETFFTQYKYEDLSLEDKVRYDLFLVFTINSLYWMYLRTKGIDPNQHDIKSQISRVREYMQKSKSVYERKTIMPRLDKEAAERFVKSGLWTPENSKKSDESSIKEEKEENKT